MNMFGGFSGSFWKEYHQIVPKTEPIAEYEDRVALYESVSFNLAHAVVTDLCSAVALSKLIVPLVSPSQSFRHLWRWLRIRSEANSDEVAQEVRRLIDACWEQLVKHTPSMCSLQFAETGRPPLCYASSVPVPVAAELLKSLSRSDTMLAGPASATLPSRTCCRHPNSTCSNRILVCASWCKMGDRSLKHWFPQLTAGLSLFTTLPMSTCAPSPLRDRLCTKYTYTRHLYQ
jgi:hypothetical protein